MLPLMPQAGGQLVIHEEPFSAIGDYAGIPIAFEVDVVLELSVAERGMGGFQLVQRKITASYIKDYDAIPGNAPGDWVQRFDPSSSALFLAEYDGQLAGGAVIALDQADAPSQGNVAILWDIRVMPNLRRRGIATTLFASAEQWARARACRGLLAETQNINVPACNFYLSQGCELSDIRRFAYPDLPGEIQLWWYRNLSVASQSARQFAADFSGA